MGTWWRWGWGPGGGEDGDLVGGGDGDLVEVGMRTFWRWG